MNYRLKQKWILPLCGASVFGFTLQILGQNGPGQTNTPEGQTPSQRTTPDTQPGTQNGQTGGRQSNPNNSNSQTERNANTGTTDNALMRAIEMNVAEVEAGRAAESKAQNPKVKAFAQMMVKDHTEALMKLHAVQSSENHSDMKPSSAHRQSIDSMSKMSGAEFDREYINMMVKDHQEALTFLEQQSKTGNANTGGNANNPGLSPNTTLAKISEEMIPTVRHHLDEAKSIQKELGGSSTSDTPSNSNRNSESTNSEGTPITNPDTNTDTNRGTRTSPSPNGTPNNPNSTPGTR